ncbi:N-acetyltransferase [Nocardia uniformis]|uniref:N-acetyltransferase n=1 Tax=Nocardia uniformis TaxID=53432 RepID=A0A849CFB1_9NOCA|nr:GNAT family N-acetyltransferase [Nocardia uniformis]NNH74229.1 N-acetyltransferase [Nocardia uniformis]
MSETTVIQRPDASPQHYEISVDAEHAGLTAYVDNDEQRIFFHTEVDERFAGQGLASKLISAALADTRAAGKRIVPVCPFVAKFVGKHHEFDDLVDPVTPQALAAAQAAQA